MSIETRLSAERETAKTENSGKAPAMTFAQSEKRFDEVKVKMAAVTESREKSQAQESTAQKSTPKERQEPLVSQSKEDQIADEITAERISEGDAKKDKAEKLGIEILDEKKLLALIK